MCDEILRTATTTTRLRPTFQRVMEVLEGPCPQVDAMNNLRLKETCEELFTCREGMRKQEVKVAEDLILKVLTARGSDILALGPEEVTDQKVRTKEVDALLFGLGGFKSFPNVMGMIKNLQTWLNDNAKHMAWCDFIDATMDAGKHDTVDLNFLAELMARACGHNVDKTNPNEVVHVASLLLVAMRSFVTEAGVHPKLSKS